MGKKSCFRVHELDNKYARVYCDAGNAQEAAEWAAYVLHGWVKVTHGETGAESQFLLVKDSLTGKTEAVGFADKRVMHLVPQRPAPLTGKQG